MKLATAEPINDVSICEATNGHSSQQSPSEENQITLSHPLPDDITMEQKEKFLALMSHYTDIMADSPDKLGQTGVLQHQIDTGSAMPI